ncbi:hypothetical protein D3C73_1122030 [compost metagenome]
MLGNQLEDRQTRNCRAFPRVVYLYFGYGLQPSFLHFSPDLFRFITWPDYGHRVIRDFALHASDIRRLFVFTNTHHTYTLWETLDS